MATDLRIISSKKKKEGRDMIWVSKNICPSLGGEMTTNAIP